MTPINRKIKIGVIGDGAFAARQHLPYLVESGYAEVVVLYRRNQEMLTKIADHFKVENTFTNYRTMLDKVEMGGVPVTSPQQTMDNCIDAILGHAQPLATGDDGLRVVEVIEAAYQSSRTGEIISLSLQNSAIILCI